jgi:hypothetical protein
MTRRPRYAPALVAWALVVSLAGGCASLGFETPDSLTLAQLGDAFEPRGTLSP